MPASLASIKLYFFFFFSHRGTLKPDNTYTAFIDTEVNIRTVTKVKFLWNNNVINPTFPKIGASAITVQSGETGEE